MWKMIINKLSDDEKNRLMVLLANNGFNGKPIVLERGEFNQDDRQYLRESK